MEYPDYSVYDLLPEFDSYMYECEQNLLAQGVTVTLALQKSVAKDVLWDFGTFPEEFSKGRIECAIICAIQKHYTLN